MFNFIDLLFPEYSFLFNILSIISPLIVTNIISTSFPPLSFISLLIRSKDLFMLSIFPGFVKKVIENINDKYTFCCIVFGKNNLTESITFSDSSNLDLSILLIFLYSLDLITKSLILSSSGSIIRIFENFPNLSKSPPLPDPTSIRRELSAIVKSFNAFFLIIL